MGQGNIDHDSEVVHEEVHKNEIKDHQNSCDQTCVKGVIAF